MTLTLIGLCGGTHECLTLSALAALRDRSRVRFARSRDAGTDWLQSDEGGVDFDSTFESVDYPSADPADAIAGPVLAAARASGAVYLTPGHPVLSERVSVRLFLTARHEGIPVNVFSLNPRPERQSLSDFGSLVEIMARLRDPVSGCPWDREQTPETLKRYVIEEAYEVVEAIDTGVPHKLAEELGDVILQVVFHAQLAGEVQQFDVDDVINHIVEKLIRRHPHVFGDISVDDADQVLANWEQIKRGEKGYEDRKSVLDGIPKDLPALMRALEVSKRVVKVGFEWPTVLEVLDKVEEEIGELRAEIKAGNTKRAEAELGDLLFTVVNVARQLKVDPEEALRVMTHRFGDRFRKIEDHAAATGRTVDQMPLDEMETVWQAAKHKPSS